MNNEKICQIFGAGGYFTDLGTVCLDNSLVIAADGGYEALQKIGVKPDIVIGDFDSCEKPNVDCIVLPRVKDDTDMLAAIRIGLEKGCTLFHLWGGTGGKREDHTAANVQCLIMLAKKGYRGILHGNGCDITAISNGRIDFEPKQSGYISVFSASEKSEGVTIQGLRYTLDGVTLTNDMPLGVSNEYVGLPSFIEVKQGTLIIYY